MKRVKFLNPDSEKPPVFFKTEEDVRYDFHYAFTNTSSIVGHCELCGRTYFNGDESGFFDEGEYEEYQEKAKKEPDKYIEVGYSISEVKLAGLGQTVTFCRCGAFQFLEKFLWAHRRSIAEYFNSRRKEELENSKREFENTEVKI